MNSITYKYFKNFKQEDIKALYDDAEWISYTKDLPRLMKAIESSLMVISAWDGDKLVGLVRVVGDGLTIIYVQDILVLQSYKKKGIGSKLLKFILDEYKDVRQKVLLTDEREETRRFYEANGFFSCDNGMVVAFAKFD
ncbi:GNAT family N-acetyltransferase [Tissierella sp. MB52-C2]|uniref:GNAT family N-acetyltransferase n=1 Tax=Tissierella sp. MB52-C2 TaxID=3070999 RepID=UPI00280AF7DD|nr:GNAT family N-acetyltransferase [Tissierella sp. MB52-C2]WMM25497.1 GNAT family N-acetyltransferase [Tissierella sp. MB52-C2]